MTRLFPGRSQVRIWQCCAPDDCEAAALWLLKNARAEFGSDRLFLGGESSGAHLATLTLLRLRDRHGAADRFEGANLLYGIYDAGFTPSHRLAGRCRQAGHECE